MRSKKIFSIVGIVLAAAWPALGQTPQLSPKGGKGKQPAAAPALTPQQKFVLDTVKTALSLSPADPQDRLRVLASASNVVSPIDQKMARKLWREGARLESEIIRSGQTPAVSLMSTGQVDCVAAQQFVENLPESAIVSAEQSIIGAVTRCRKQTLDLVARRLDAALDKNMVAPRALMATIEAEGPKTPWSQNEFEKMFRSLPDPHASETESENFAAMYMRMAGEVDKGTARKTGLELLEWLGKMDDSSRRTLAVNITTSAMSKALGDEGYRDALNSDVVAGSTVRSAQNSQNNGKIERPPFERASVLGAMRNRGEDQTDRLRDLPASQRAREAAAHGFAVGISGDKQQAGKYFDMAFSAVDDVWQDRTPEQNTAAVVEEVSEAAAQVDSLNALERAQKLRDPSAQAIAMLAVARVVASKGVVR